MTRATVGELLVKISADARELIAGVEGAADRVAGFGDQIQKVGKRAGDIGKGLTKNVTLPLAALGGGAIAAAVSFEKAQGRIARATGATGDDLEDLGKTMREVFARVPEDAGTVADAIGEINTRFGLIGKPLEDATERFLAFARVNEVDVQDSVRNASRALKIFGEDAEQLPHLLDMVNVAAQDSGISVDSLFQGIERGGAVLNELGFGLTDTIALMASFEEQGVDANRALRPLGRAMSQLTAEGADADEAFEQLIGSIKNAETASEAGRIAAEIFGDNIGQQLAPAIRRGAFDLEDMVAALEASEGSVEATDEASRDFTRDIKELRDELLLMAEPLGVTLVDALKELMPLFRDGIERVKGLVEGFTNLDEGTKRLIIGIAGAAAALGPFLMVGGKILTLFGGILKALPGLIAGAKMLVGALGPIGIILALLAPLIAKVLIESGALGRIMDALSPLFDALVGALEPLMGAFEGIIGVLIDALVPVIEVLAEIIVILAEVLAAILVPLIQGPVAFVLRLLATVLEFVITALVKAIGWIFKTFSPISLLIQHADSLAEAFHEMADFILLAWEAVTAGIGTAWESVMGFFENAWGFITGLFDAAMQTIWTLLTSFPGILWLPNLIFERWDEVKLFFAEAWEFMVESVRDAGKRIVEFVLGMIDNIVSPITDLVDTMFQLGMDVITGFWDGLKSVWGSVVDWFDDALDDLIDMGKGLLGISSPSRVFMEMGEAVGEGFNLGLDKEEFELEARLVGALRDAEFPEGGEAGDGLGSGQTLVQIDRIEIPASEVPADRDPEEFAREVVVEIRRQLRDGDRGGGRG